MSELSQEYLQDVYNRLDELEQGYRNLAHIVKMMHKTMQSLKLHAEFDLDSITQQINDLLK